MIPDDTGAIAAQLMSTFATRTGLSPAALRPRRYLWTDAFAVCNFFELFARAGDQTHRRYAVELIDQVHQVLGRYRNDDTRSGWISGLDDETGRYRPTAGGLRIGKPLKERAAGEPIDERLEWDRDGQYFHYLTKWVHALCQAGFATGNAEYARWAVELAEIAFAGFIRRSGSGQAIGLYWKMSTDLSRPLVPAMGMHDALDGFITFREAQHAGAAMSADVRANDLGAAIESLSTLCRHRDWMTDDPLGIGGLLFDACRLIRLIDEPIDVDLLESLLDGCLHGLTTFLAGRSLNRPVSHRLPFRELGLAIGLRGLPMLAEASAKTGSGFGRRPALRQVLDQLLKYELLGEEIVNVWLPHAQRQGNWQAHQDINDVMLATALLPDMFLSVGERSALIS